MPTRGDRHLRTLKLAKQLAALGARLKTIQLITGMLPSQAQQLFFADAHTIPRGRAPSSAEWYHGANLILRTDACLIGSKYRQLRGQGLHAGEALVFSYRAYRAVTASPCRISLDRAFNLVSYIEGIWLARAPTLAILTCPNCRCEFLAAVGSVAHHGTPCPFCKLLERFHVDHRIQSSYPVRAPLDMTRRPTGILVCFPQHGQHAEDDSPIK